MEWKNETIRFCLMGQRRGDGVWERVKNDCHFVGFDSSREAREFRETLPADEKERFTEVLVVREKKTEVRTVLSCERCGKEIDDFPFHYGSRVSCHDCWKSDNDFDEDFA